MNGRAIVDALKLAVDDVSLSSNGNSVVGLGRPDSGYRAVAVDKCTTWEVVMTNGGRAVVVGEVIARSPAEVWADVRNIESHVTWMQDAVAIRFLSESREGAGTRFECDTKVGPFALTDVMEVTSWEDERRMGVRHVGLVAGTGEFTLSEVGPGRTEFRWEEDLSFPWFLGGPIGAFAARPVLRRVWRGNLKRLAARLEQQGSSTH